MDQEKKNEAPPPYEEAVGTSSNTINLTTKPEIDEPAKYQNVENQNLENNLRPGDVQFSNWVNESAHEPPQSFQPQAYSQQMSIESNSSHSTVQPPQHPIMTTTTTVFVNSSALGPAPTRVQCPHCLQEVNTSVKYVSGLLTWLIFFGTLLFGCWLGCCLIPFYMKSCKDVEHYCEKCKTFLGIYKRL